MKKSAKLLLLALLIFYLPGLERASAQIDTICVACASRYQLIFLIPNSLFTTSQAGK